MESLNNELSYRKTRGEDLAPLRANIRNHKVAIKEGRLKPHNVQLANMFRDATTRGAWQLTSGSAHAYEWAMVTGDKWDILPSEFGQATKFSSAPSVQQALDVGQTAVDALVGALRDLRTYFGLAVDPAPSAVAPVAIDRVAHRRSWQCPLTSVLPLLVAAT